MSKPLIGLAGLGCIVVMKKALNSNRYIDCRQRSGRLNHGLDIPDDHIARRLLLSLLLLHLIFFRLGKNKPLQYVAPVSHDSGNAISQVLFSPIDSLPFSARSEEHTSE